MSTENTATTGVNYEKDVVSGLRFVRINDNLNVVETVLTREGLFKGFVIHQPDPTTLTGATALFNSDESSLLDALDRSIGQMVYARAIARLKSKLPQDQGENEKTKAWLLRHKDEIESLKLTDPVLFSIEDATGFRPGERELTPAGILRAIAKAQAAGTKLLSEGKMTEAIQEFNRVKELMEKFSEVTAQLQKQAEELDAEGGGDEQN